MPSTTYKKDKAIIEACVHGEPGSWNEFIREYDRLLISIVFRFSRQLSTVGLDAEDLKGHVYEKLLDNGCKRLLAWKGRAKFSTFLVVIARNLALDYIAKYTKGPLLERSDDIPEQENATTPIEDMELAQSQISVLAELLHELPEKQAVILRMRLEGRSLREIAKALNKPIGTVSVENSRALENLRTKLQKSHPELWQGRDT